MSKPEQIRTHSSKKPQSPQRQTLRLKHGSNLKPGQRIGPLLMPGIAGFFDWSDTSLLSFVAQFIADNASVSVAETSGAARDLIECQIIARAVLKTPRFWESFRFPLPGLAAHRLVTVEQTLCYLATRWHAHQAEWRRLFVLAMDGEFEWAQVTVVCEAFLCRDGVLEEIEYEGPAHRAAAKHYPAALRIASKHGNS